MPIINVDERVWRALLEQVRMLTTDVQQTKRKFEPKPADNWLDSQQVCEAFSINKQTLKAYRVRGHLAFSRVGGKFFYREQDVAEFLQARTIRKEV